MWHTPTAYILEHRHLNLSGAMTMYDPERITNEIGVTSSGGIYARCTLSVPFLLPELEPVAAFSPHIRLI